MKVYSGSAWQSAGSSVNGTSARFEFIATAGQTTFTTSGFDPGYVDVYQNGIKLIVTTDFSDTNGTDIVLTTGANLSDEISVVAYGTFQLADVYSKAQADALLDAKADASNTYTETEVNNLLDAKADTLVSGSNIKTVNGNSLVGSGNINVGKVLQVVTGSFNGQVYTTSTTTSPSSTTGYQLWSVSFTPISASSTILVQTSSIAIGEESNVGDMFYLGAWHNSSIIGVNGGTRLYTAFAGWLGGGNYSLNHTVQSWGTTANTITIRAGGNAPAWINGASAYNLGAPYQEIGLTILEIGA
jgi:hypothetical protein